MCVSPLSTQQFNLETVNEQDEFLNHKTTNHQKANSSSSNNIKDFEKERNMMKEWCRKQKANELELLKTFKVHFYFNYFRPKFLS